MSIQHLYEFYLTGICNPTTPFPVSTSHGSLTTCAHATQVSAFVVPAPAWLACHAPCASLPPKATILRQRLGQLPARSGRAGSSWGTSNGIVQLKV